MVENNINKHFQEADKPAKPEPRIRGVGNKGSHSQDADRHRKIDHPKSDK